MAESVYDFTVENIMGLPQSLDTYRGKVLLIVNTASKCGLTPQYAGLQELYEQYRDRGFEILGFPSNQFANQEPGTESEIREFCQVNYGVTFPMFAKIDVNGAGAHPLYKFLKQEASGALGIKAIKWNFTKFLVDREGRVLERFEPNIVPKDMAPRIEKVL
ncbi:MAG: glutathione peroxidase [Anaerolineae bacterium]|nr:glutathione peroxidase [Anaerolineae bacterium]